MKKEKVLVKWEVNFMVEVLDAKTGRVKHRISCDGSETENLANYLVEKYEIEGSE